MAATDNPSDPVEPLRRVDEVGGMSTSLGWISAEVWTHPKGWELRIFAHGGLSSRQVHSAARDVERAALGGPAEPRSYGFGAGVDPDGARHP